MSKTVFLFSGQGSQYPGMGREIYDHYEKARDVYDEASDVLGFDVIKLSGNGTAAELAQTAVSQPLIYTLSMAVYAVLSDVGILPQAVAGFSLGEVSALTAAGGMDLETGFRVIKHRAEAMSRASKITSGSMFAVLGAEVRDIEEECRKIRESGQYVEPVNYNCPGQIVIAGETGAAKKAAEIFEGNGIRVVPLAVSAAFHSKLMQPASEEFYHDISSFSFGSPALPIYSNVTGTVARIDSIPDYLKKQMVSPVRFIDEMSAMEQDQIESFVELGPGRTLRGFVRKGIKGARTYNVEDVKSFSKCAEELKG